jgi:hypothetical protein
MTNGGDTFRAAPEYHDLLRAEGLDAEAVFSHPKIVVWRKLEDRENCTMDAAAPDGRVVKLHIKRYPAAGGETTPADQEAAGLRALQVAKIPTAPLVGWGRLRDGRSFIILEDLAGFRAADKLLEDGADFERLLEPTADLAAALHSAGLHHRDLYLNHFFVRGVGSASADRLLAPDLSNSRSAEADPTGTISVRLIDAARVRPLPGWPMRNRWIVKDLAQFWYSAVQAGISQELRMRWLERYAQQRAIVASKWQRAIERKVAWIQQHDRKLNQRQPHRNVAIPDESRLNRDSGGMGK